MTGAAASIALRGPARSTHRPKTAAERPRKTIARLKVQPMVLSFQSPGTERVMPSEWESGRLNTLNA